MFFTGLTCTKLGDETKNAKITKFNAPLNLFTIR